MANQVGARLAGDDYQHLFGWYYLLELLVPDGGVVQVAIEDSDAVFADDITILHAADSGRADRFLQVKYHVDHRSGYSSEVLLEAPNAGRSLLRKLYESWKKLHAPTGRPIEIHLVSNWAWNPTDPIGQVIRGADLSLANGFFTATPRSGIGKARERWRAHLGIDPDEFDAFARTLRFRLGSDCAADLQARVSERMGSFGLRNDSATLLIAVGLVRVGIKERRSKFGREEFERLLREHDLYLPPNVEPATTVYLVGVKEQRFDLAPDHLLDWREYFEGDPQKKGHQVLDPSVWNERMLPELQALEQKLNATTTARLIRARGLARLSPWFAFGYTFSHVARYTIEIDQQGQLWRTDAVPADLSLIEGERFSVEGGDAQTVAVGLSVTGSLETAVRDHLKETRAAHTALFLRPNRELGPDCFSTAGDAVAFARKAKARLRTFVDESRAHRLLVFYFGPLSGACFLGHQLNAVAPEVQIMERVPPGYEPAFLLT